MERTASDAGLGELLALHEEVDREAARLAARHGSRLQCRRGCSACCVDDLTVFEIEARRIRAAHPALLGGEAPHAPGACAFLDGAGGCRIYADRPYVCRTQGLPLRWWAEDEREELVESRDVCPLNAEGPALGSLAADDCWLIGPFEDRLRRLQEARDGGRGRRVALRSLFRSSS
ncbi:MAG: YkgJ family cysteine cluster protein [Myxococcota bacterium]